MGGAVIWGLPWLEQIKKGGHPGSLRRAVIGLDLRQGPIRRKYGRGLRLG
jgi:hypothetical protein